MPVFPLRSLGTQWRCVEAKGSLSLLMLTPIVEDECEEGAYLVVLMLLVVHFAVMVTISWSLCARSSKSSKITE